MHRTSLRTFPAWALLFGSLTGGCAYEEGLLVQNLKGTVRVPKEATTRTIARADGSEETIPPDVKLIGPVYLGLYPSVFEAGVIERYPHPEVGPQYIENVPGNTYPYGGTTVGDFRFPCLDFLNCKLTSGRFLDYQEIVDWFAYLEQPVVDAAGAEVASGDYIRQTCYDLLNVTSDDEVRLTAFADRDNSGAIDRQDLDFVDAGDFWEAEFTIWQQELFWDKDQADCTPGVSEKEGGCKGFSLWGWMDAPSDVSYQFSTCEPGEGFLVNEYNSEIFSGRPYLDVLNFPATYISDGDYTASEGFVWYDIHDEPEIVLDFKVE